MSAQRYSWRAGLVLLAAQAHRRRTLDSCGCGVCLMLRWMDRVDRWWPRGR